MQAAFRPVQRKKRLYSPDTYKRILQKTPMFGIGVYGRQYTARIFTANLVSALALTAGAEFLKMRNTVFIELCYRI